MISKQTNLTIYDYENNCKFITNWIICQIKLYFIKTRNTYKFYMTLEILIQLNIKSEDYQKSKISYPTIKFIHLEQ